MPKSLNHNKPEGSSSRKAKSGQLDKTNHQPLQPRYIPIAPYGEPISPPQINNPTRIIAKACDQCRRMKVKCQFLEGFKSCRKCTNANRECTFIIKSKKRGPQQGYVSALENRLKRAEELISKITGELHTLADTDDLSVNNSSAEDNDEHQHGNQNIDTNKGVLKERQTSELNCINDIYLQKVYNEFTHDGRFVRENNLIRVLLESKHGKIFREELLSRYGVNIQYNEESNCYSLKKIATSEEDRRRQIKELIEVGIISPHETIKDINQWIYKVSGIDKTMSDRLLQIYFAYIHPLLPVVNKTEFLQQYRGIKSTYPDGFLLNAIYGAAAQYVENCKKFNDLDSLDDKGSWDFPEGFSENLFEGILNYLKSKYTPRISTIQAIIIAHNHSSNVDNWTSGWLMNCAAVRMCQEIGLHRATKGWNISEQEKETRKIVWWSAYVLDRWFSAGSGRPLTIFDEDCDVEYPTVDVSIDEILDTMTEEDQHLPRFPSVTEYITTDVKSIKLNEPFIQLLKLSEILGFVLQNLYTPKAKKHSEQYGSDSIVAYVNSALAKWRAALPARLEISKASEITVQNKDHDPLTSVSGLICLCYCTLLILLHRPFIERSTNKEKAGENSKISSQNPLMICTSAAIRIAEVAESMHYRDFLLVSWGFALYPLFTAALIHIYNCSNPEFDIANVAKHNLMRTLTLLRKLYVLSPLATDMGLVLKKVITDSAIFVNDTEFISRLRTYDPELSARYTTIDSETFKQKYASSCLSNLDITDASERSSINKKDSSHLNVPTSVVNDEPKQFYDSNQVATLLANSLMDSCEGDTSKQNTLASELTLQTQATPSHHTNSQSNQQPTGIFNAGAANTNSNANLQPPHLHPVSTLDNMTYKQQNASLSNLEFNNNNGLLSSAPIDQFQYQDNSVSYDFLNPDLFYLQPMVPGLSNDGSNLNVPSSWYTGNQHQQQDLSVIFRHSPGNPFWSIPTSMEMEEWAAYLLPNQQ